MAEKLIDKLKKPEELLKYVVMPSYIASIVFAGAVLLADYITNNHLPKLIIDGGLGLSAISLRLSTVRYNRTKDLEENLYI